MQPTWAGAASGVGVLALLVGVCVWWRCKTVPPDSASAVVAVTLDAAPSAPPMPEGFAIVGDVVATSENTYPPMVEPMITIGAMLTAIEASSTWSHRDELEPRIPPIVIEARH